MNLGMHPQDAFSLPQYQRGVNLIEIMVAMIIGLFLVMGATTLYVNSKKSSNVDDAIARLQETARYAMGVIETDVREANYWGLLKDATEIENRANSGGTLVDSTPCIANFAINLESYLAGTNNSYGFNTATTNTVCNPIPGIAVSTSDTLTVRRASTTSATSISNTRLQICSTRQHGWLIAGGTCAAWTENPALGHLNNLIVNTYYVDTQADQGSTVPSLRRKTLIAGPTYQDVEVIPGIEDMQIQFGWDSTAGDAALGNPAQAVRYVNPNNVPTTGQIVAVRVWLLVRAETTDPTFTNNQTYTYGDRAAYTPNDNYRRILVSRTFFIRNVVGT